jgi:tRNA pseudouridine55 synthase
MISKKIFTDSPDFQAGEVLLINKTLNWTSFDVVNSLRSFIRYNFGLKKIKIGHAGTLDPLATGLVIVCTGKKTKEINTYQAQQKTYTGTFYIGQTTPSFDLETLPDKTYPTRHITPEYIYDAAKTFIGETEQTPPIFSAVKINGKKAYDYARNNEEVTMRKRKVTIYEFEITAINLPEVAFRVVCSKGTYIRSLANDFGQELGSGAYLSSLCRTAIGDYENADALTVEEFKNRYRDNATTLQQGN